MCVCFCQRADPNNAETRILHADFSENVELVGEYFASPMGDALETVSGWPSFRASIWLITHNNKVLILLRDSLVQETVL